LQGVFPSSGSIVVPELPSQLIHKLNTYIVNN
jgi:hypothetical protein